MGNAEPSSIQPQREAIRNLLLGDAMFRGQLRSTRLGTHTGIAVINPQESAGGGADLIYVSGTVQLQDGILGNVSLKGLVGGLEYETVYGERTKVMVIREENGERHVEVLNLKSKDIFNSPYFYLKQNDVVYVEPVGAKAKSVSTFTTYFPVITSLASLGTSIAMIIYYITFASRVK